MEKKNEDDELKKLLEEEYIKEAEMLEEALFSDDDDFKDDDKTDEEVRASYDKLVERLKADGVYREEDARVRAITDVSIHNDKVIDRLIKNSEQEGFIIMPDVGKFNKKGYTILKVASLIMVCIIGVFTASMTSEANRNYVIQNIKYLIGDDTKILIGNDEENDDIKGDEGQARSAISEELGVEVPEFMYRPEYLDFYDYRVDSVAQIAVVEYKYKETMITLHIDKKYENKGSGNFSLHGQQIDSMFIDDENIEVNILEICDKQDIEPSYSAQWEKAGVFYQVSGKMEKGEFIKLIEQIKF